MRAPARLDFTHVEDWVFDLDNTLYPSECDLFAQIDARMTAFVAAAVDVDAVEAHRLQKLYYAEHGTTLNGLIKFHDVDPHAYLAAVHDIDLSPIQPCAQLAANIAALPGRKFVFTNASRGHAEAVLEKRGLTGLFDGVFDIVSAGFAPKPLPQAYARFTAAFDIEAARSAMFEDIARNLQVPHASGVTTVLVRTHKDWSGEPAEVRPAGPGAAHAHVGHVTDNLTGFLAEIAVRR